MKNELGTSLLLSFLSYILLSLSALAQEDCGLDDFNMLSSLAPFGSELNGTTTVYYNSSQQIYVFNYNNEVEYWLNVGDPDVQQGILKIFEKYSQYYPILGAGTRYRIPSGTYISPEDLKPYSQLTQHRVCENNVVALYYTDTYPGRATPNYKMYTLELRGKMLIIHVFSNYLDFDPNGNYAGFELKPFSSSNNYVSLKTVHIPYLSQIPVFLINNNIYQTIYHDMGKSRSSDIYTGSYPNYPLYYPFDDGSISPLEETIYLIVSTDIYDTFPKNRNPESIYKEKLNNKVVLDIWNILPEEMAWYSRGYPRNQGYNKTRDFIDRLYDLGFTELAIILHVWKKDGYDYRTPEHYPAVNYYGTDDDFKELIKSSIKKRHLFALHENYEEIGVDSSYWNQSNLEDLAYDRYLSMRQGYSQYESYVVASNKQQKYASYESSKIKDNYLTNAAYLDVVPGGLTYRYINYKKSVNQGSFTSSQVIQNIKNHFDAQQNRYRGPLLGETRRDSSSLYYLGKIDACEAEIFQGDGRCGIQTDLIPDFELLVIHPVMLNHGMGYYCRYFNDSCSQNWFLDPNSIDIDNYLANQIAYGHAGFLDSCYDQTKQDQISGEKLFILSYYLSQFLQSQYASAKMKKVLYLDGTDMVNLSEAIKSGLDFANPGLYIEYDNGLEIFVNRNNQNWGVTINESKEQGQNGWYFQEYLNLEGYNNLVWDPMGWKGKNKYSRLLGRYMHPDGGSIIRKWISDEQGKINISGYIFDSDVSCGDGVMVNIDKNGFLLWEKNLDGIHSSIEYINGLNDIDVSVGDEINFLIDQKANNYCDSTILYPVINLNGREITINTREFYLPPNGWVIHNPNNGFLEYSALFGCPYNCHRVDFVDSYDYTFVNARGIETSFKSSRGGITTSGIEVIKNSGFRVICDDYECLVICNSNGICDGGETQQNCPSDCKPEANDCSDGTIHGSCSRQYTHLYCNNGSLEYSCLICGCHESDTNQDNIVSMNELINYIGMWKVSSKDVLMKDMMEAIRLWNS